MTPYKTAEKWLSADSALLAIQKKLTDYAPKNEAAMPIAMAQQFDKNGKPYWTVDLCVEVGDEERDVMGKGFTLLEALRNAFLAMRRWGEPI